MQPHSLPVTVYIYYSSLHTAPTNYHTLPHSPCTLCHTPHYHILPAHYATLLHTMPLSCTLCHTLLRTTTFSLYTVPHSPAFYHTLPAHYATLSCTLSHSPCTLYYISCTLSHSLCTLSVKHRCCQAWPHTPTPSAVELQDAHSSASLRYKLAAANTRNMATQTDRDSEQENSRPENSEQTNRAESQGESGHSSGSRPLEMEELPHDAIVDALASAKTDILRLQQEKQGLESRLSEEVRKRQRQKMDTQRKRAEVRIGSWA